MQLLVNLTDTQDGYLRSGRVRFHQDLAPLMRPIDAVEQAPYNYNNGDVDMIAQSIEMNGMYRPIYVQQSTGFIIAGNHTWLACKSLDSEHIPAVILDVDDTTAKRIMIEDNEAAKKAQADTGLLLSLMDEIHDATGEFLASMTERDYEVLKALNDIPLEQNEFGTWPTFTVQLPPKVMRAFRHMTREADDDRNRFELLMRLAGWDGHE
jgi:hypothetical protein